MASKTKHAGPHGDCDIEFLHEHPVGISQPVLLFFNINEEGQAYEVHSALEPALTLLAEFPNDSITVIYDGAPSLTGLLRNLAETNLAVAEGLLPSREKESG
jgi:hypothetical protein